MDDPTEHVLVETDGPATERRSPTRHNSARQAAVNFMPSRQLPHNTLRLRRGNSERNALLDGVIGPDEVTDPDEADHPAGRADRIVHEMERDRRLMEDHPAAEGLRREALRELPQGLTMKRNVRAKLSATVSLRARRSPIPCWRRLRYRAGFAWQRSKERFRDFVFSIELWYEAIRHIEGQFGSAVGSYFHMLRWLLAANALAAALLAAFLVAPLAALGAGAAPGDGARPPPGGKGPADFIAGTGFYADSLLFYGHYRGGNLTSGGPLVYNMSLAYFFTMACLYLLMCAVLCYRTADSYRRNFIETAGGLRHVFAGKVFCGWDFGIVSREAAALGAASIYNELKELLNEQNMKRESVGRCARAGRCLVNAGVWALLLAGGGALGVAGWRLLGAAQDQILVSSSVTVALAILPLLFNQIVRLEFYSPRTALYVTLARTWLLGVGAVLLLFYYWTQSQRECWETSFGQEAYRLLLLDSLVCLFILPLVEAIRYFAYKCWPKLSAPEFNIAYNSLTLVYNQTLVWFGLVFCPLLALCAALKLLLLFYVRRLALGACLPAGKPWRAAQTQTVLYMLVTLSLFAAMFAIGSLFLRMSSLECGPFRDYEFVYQVWSEGVLGLSRRPTLGGVLSLAARPGALGFLALALCVAVYYMRARARAQLSTVRILRHMLVLQAKDKEFLLAAIAKVSNGEWLYRPKPAGEGAGDSHTGRYLRDVRRPSNSGFHLRRASPARAQRPERPPRASRRDSDGSDSSFCWKRGDAPNAEV